MARAVSSNAAIVAEYVGVAATTVDCAALERAHTLDRAGRR
jgi:hypothetical protein